LHEIEDLRVKKGEYSMTRISRRSVLAGLAAAPILAKAAPSLADSKSSGKVGARTLCLYVHGAVIVDLRPDGMVIHAPRVTMSGKLAHDYRIGYGNQGEGDELDPGVPLALLGFAGAAQPPQIDKTVNPYLGTRPLDGTGDFCSLITPLPVALIPLRQIKKDDSCGDFFPGIQDLATLAYLPTVLRIDFYLQANETVRLIDGQWKDEGKANPVIHFRAEPGELAYASHNAFLAMSTAVGMLIQLAPGYCKAAVPYKIPDERSLLELNYGGTGITVLPCATEIAESDPKVQKASRPANCVYLVVNNTGVPLT
jgi:hypothetical protein